MKGVVTNLSQGRLARSAALLVGLALCTAVVGGAAAVPAARMRDVRAAGERAAAEALRHRSESRLLDEWRESGRSQRIAAASAALASALPPEPDELELHALLRLMAKESGVKLTAIQFGRTADLEAGYFEGRAGRKEVFLNGEAGMRAFASFCAALESLEHPVRALDLGLTAGDRDGARRSLRLGLGLYCALPGRPRPSAVEATTNESELP